MRRARTLVGMAIYEYRCRTCDERFEVSRPMSAPTPAVTPCPAGHSDTVKLLSAFAKVGASVGGPAAACGMPMQAAMSGGCGGGCACH